MRSVSVCKRKDCCLTGIRQVVGDCSSPSTWKVPQALRIVWSRSLRQQLNTHLKMVLIGKVSFMKLSGMVGSVLRLPRWLISVLIKGCLWLVVVSTLVTLLLISTVNFSIQQCSLKMASALVAIWAIFDPEARKSQQVELLQECCQSFKPTWMP